ncbi:Mn2+ and Fe2+ transporters of the NRAMP family [Streptococcus gallolyticus]|uniref:Mn2+ and Fe2+ transporters of the NRAMP family n=1 Tax=Streptococcus gallolyticus TaxID=315405 RepID=A0A1H7U6P3_9STRE|nr:NRAMP family divalent metal transporter [Streptococcus gallolyticus]MCY7172095.1 divalent metal cation transporter [Streptococcus gallolyticus subsp. gallolyticus]SDJ71644.1 Mn2+ and Fe2+ transporters of the NRAMP family [Streptococcus gallolyticus]SDL22016.1 Mn2+ and Fe2+ transporters of the NRAMP family [Streptococcus gallolyticus]SEF19719.1 Mn2+ and Fe2+ transporters of the NRAMP family [Streptococcus gallolyticus]SEL92651.1 Mn2+ and Fe2+ transporters of the NRAMP family [Streptococcus g
MTENIEQQSNWRTKLKALGPGILMASAAVGGSHIVSSTQAGAIYGWQLALVILLINIFKYPFFRFGSQYTMENDKSLIEGYAEKGKGWLAIFFVLNIFSAIVNTAGVGILCAAILYNIFPNGFGLSISQLTTIIIVIIWAMLLIGGYKFLDSLAKWVMTALTIATVVAVVIALLKHREYAPDFEAPTPWRMAALPFIVSLMGWMPCPIEISAINSMWSVEKRKQVKMSEADAIFDFNTGYIGTAILALIFCALGALIQFGSGEEVQSASAAYIAQFVNMYASVLGEWSRFLITLIAFLCIFGTVLTVIDGYSRANNEALRLLLDRREASQKALYGWMTLTAVIGLVIVYLFAGNVATMLRFAMIASFITTPFFAYLNYSLVNNKEHQVKPWLKGLSIVGLVYLFGFALFFIIAWLTGNV